jgi:DNA-binding NarL/FixJ family response regulator
VTSAQLPNGKIRVLILEDDPYFMDLLVDVFEKSGKFEVQASFSTVEELVKQIPHFMCRFESHPEEFPELLCMDILAGPTVEVGLDSINGASLSLYLKKSDLKMAVLLISSISSAHLTALVTNKYPGFMYLHKTSKITDEEIIKTALQSVQSMRENS